MKTILYNNNTQEVISGIFPNGYIIDGQPAVVEPPIYELEYITTESPEYDLVTQYLTESWVADTEDETYTQTWTTVDRTNEQIAEYLNAQATSHIDNIKNYLLEEFKLDEYENNLTVINELGDGEALEISEQFPPYQVGVVYELGDRFYYPVNQKLYKVLQAHTSQADWLPTTAVSLYVEVTPPGVIPEWVQPQGTHDAYQLGDQVTHNGSTWESTINANVWEPGVHGWVQI